MTRPARAPTVGIAVGAGSAERDSDTPLLLEALAARAVSARAIAWDDPAGGWDAYDLVVLRSTWDYVPRRDEFLAWAESVPRLANPPDVVRWNTDKSYLRELELAGVPVVPTSWIAPGEPIELPDRDVVVKPTVGNGARGAARFRAGDPGAAAHVARLHDGGAVAMVQPFVASVEHRPETGVVVIGNRPSHAIGKPLQLGRVLRDHTEEDRGIVRAAARDDELALAASALARVPGGPDRLLYARVDMVAGDDGTPMIMELEVTEPLLFLALDDGAAGRLAAAVVDLVAAS